MPPVLAASIHYTPALPSSKRKVLKAMVPGKLIKAEAIYDRPFWRDAGLSGQSASDVGPANTTFDNSPPDGSVGVLFGFVGGKSADGLPGDGAGRPPRRGDREPRRGRRRAGAHARPTTSSRTGPTSSGRAAARSATSPPACCARNGAHLRSPHGAIHFAGTETADYWLGYMDGGVRAGERAAREVLRDLRS